MAAIRVRPGPAVQVRAALRTSAIIRIIVNSASQTEAVRMFQLVSQAAQELLGEYPVPRGRRGDRLSAYFFSLPLAYSARASGAELPDPLECRDDPLGRRVLRLKTSPVERDRVCFIYILAGSVAEAVALICCQGSVASPSERARSLAVPFGERDRGIVCSWTHHFWRVCHV